MNSATHSEAQVGDALFRTQEQIDSIDKALLYAKRLPPLPSITEAPPAGGAFKGAWGAQLPLWG